MATEVDVLVVGAGHNGLVAAFYLATAGLRTLVLERRDLVGGAAVTEELHPGFRCSTLAHATGPLLGEIVQDLQLERHGLRFLRPAVHLFAPAEDGRALVLYEDGSRSIQAIEPFSRKDAGRYEEFTATLGRIGNVLAPLLRVTPPSIDNPTRADAWSLLGPARRFRRLSRKDAYRLLRWVPMPAADLVAEWFEHDLLQAVSAAPGLLGAFAGPWSAGTGAALLLKAAIGRQNGASGLLVQGGLGAVTAAMAAAVRSAGGTIRTGAGVERIMVQGEAATGVALASGEEIAARAVVSCADPRRTLLGLIDPVHLDPDFVNRIQHFRCRGAVAKVNLALSGLPRFAAARAWPSDQASAALSGRIHIGPSIDYLEQAFDAAKYGGFSRRPHLEAVIPSLTDPTLAPAGQHVMSVYMQYAPYELAASDWPAQRDALGDVVVDTLAGHAPGFDRLVIARQVITPLDLERTYGLTGGHIHHGEMALDQLFTMRPLLGWARYRTPIRNLYLCGSGTHPGGGVTGASGLNASREILKDLRR